MMLALLRRDPAVRSLPKWLFVGALTANVLAGVRVLLVTLRGADASADPHFGDLLLLVLALWLPVALFLALGGTGLRCSRFDLAMPLSARRLNAAHVVGVLLSGTIVLAMAAGVITLHDGLVGRAASRSLVPQPGVEGVVLVVASTLILVAAVLLSVQPGVYRTPSGRLHYWLVAAQLVAGLALILLLTALPLAVTIVPLVVAAVLLQRSSRALSATLTLVPLAGAETDDRGHDERWSQLQLPTPLSKLDPLSRRFRLARLDATLVHVFGLGIAPAQMIRIPVNLVSIPFLIGMGLLLSGFAFDNAIRLTNITLTAYILIAFFAGPLAQLHLVDSLPISRRRIFALLILPGLLLVAVGYGAGRLGIAQRTPRPAIVFTSGIAEHLAPPYRSEIRTLRVPSTQFRTAWDGEVPVVEAPWGESPEPWRIPLFRGSTAMVYSPFSATEDNSADFVAWQIGRAVEAVYGRSISHEEIRDRYLTTSPDGVVTLRNPAGLTLLEDYPELDAGGEDPTFPVVLLLTGSLWLVLASIYLRTYRTSVSARARIGVFFALLGLMMLLHIGQFIGFIVGFCEDWVVLGQVEAGILWLARVLPGGDVGVWILCALLFAGVYRWAQGRFERIEVPLPRPKPVA